jgi:predicted dehydrogenase
MTGAVRLALIGATGHGGWHLRNIAELQARGRVELVGLCDVRDVPGAPEGVPLFREHAALLEAVKPEVVVVCTPPHTHLRIASDVAWSGADLLLEKPPVRDVAEHDALRHVLAQTGRACQIGFQALGSAALTRLRGAIDAGALGTVTGIAVRGSWFREEAYFHRAAWVGRRSVDGELTLDGALANPFAHAVMQLLAIADAPLRSARVERYRTRDIEVDDTACVRLRFDSEVDGFIAVTLCGEEFVPGDITVTGSGGTAVLEYPTDRLRLPGEADLTHGPGRVGLLDNLLDHRADPTVPLLVPLARTLPFTALLAPILAAPPALIPPEYLSTHHDLATPRLSITGINAAIDEAANRMALFSELPLPWARSG